MRFCREAQVDVLQCYAMAVNEKLLLYHVYQFLKENNLVQTLRRGDHGEALGILFKEGNTFRHVYHGILGLVPLVDAIQERDTILMYTHHNRLHVYVSRVELSPLIVEEQHTQYKLEIYIDHIGVDFVISKYIFPNASLAEMMNHVITDYSSENEGIIRQETQNDYTFDKMVEWAEQEHFEYEETKTSHTISPISTMLSSTIESCLSYTHFFSPLTYYMAYGANEARQAIVLKLQREIQAEKTLAYQLSCNLARYTEETPLDEEAILEEQMLALMHHFADRFIDLRVEINNLMFEIKEVKEAHESDVRHLEGLVHDVVKLGAEYG
ncbi:hypothetical protein Tco_1316931 [Tanacetum coccineum]